jgi:IMP dehydrogenase
MRKGLTYSNVLLVPKKTLLKSRQEAGVKTRFTRNVELNVPLVSSNMATVTEHKMAIAMARRGGIGVIHQFGTIEEQAEEVRKVKRSTSYIIDDPVSIQKEETIEDAVRKMTNLGVTSLIVKEGGKLAGIFTKRDYLFENDLRKPVRMVMTPRERLIVGEYGINLEEAKKILHKNRIEKLPLILNGEIKGLVTTKDISRLEKWPHACRDQKGRLRVAAALGVKDAVERARTLVSAGVDVLVLDIAHAHSDFVIEKLKELKTNFQTDVMVGNIGTAEAAKDLIEAGADGLKIGIGPSPVCSTRIISGAGVPQLTAIMDVVSIAKQYNVPVTADGGMKFPGDIAKAIAAGASTIYSGSFFAGTDETPGMIILKDGKRYKKYQGSASYESNHSRRENQQGKQFKERLDIFVEGVSNLVDYKGPVSEVIQYLVKGLKSGISYCGARNIKEMQENAEFIEITDASWKESNTQGNKISE